MTVETKKISFTLNGKAVETLVAPDEMLIDILRKNFDCKSVKAGCHEGSCGACTIIADGRPVLSCLLRGWQIAGKDIWTVEGVGTYDAPHPVQQALVDNGAVQCGFCIPGMVLSAKAVLDENPVPEDEEMKRAMDGNLCRCTGYEKIWDALTSVIDANRKDGK